MSVEVVVKNRSQIGLPRGVSMYLRSLPGFSTPESPYVNSYALEIEVVGDDQEGALTKLRLVGTLLADMAEDLKRVEISS